jgi:hypothetical protein
MTLSVQADRVLVQLGDDIHVRPEDVIRVALSVTRSTWD